MSDKPAAYVLLSDDLPDNYCKIVGKSGVPEEGLQALSRALSSSPLWKKFDRVVLVIRHTPRPMLAAIGDFDSAARARLEALSWRLNSVLPHMRYVDYGRGEQDCQRLAQQLIDCFGREELKNFDFIAIPRGGFIVLGMLAYILGLRSQQVQPPYHTDVPLMVVDDCAFTGGRFGRFIDDFKQHQIIFAHLYSHPELRAAITEQEPNVSTCLSAYDLHDHAPENLGDGYLSWRKRWMARSNYSIYWIGQPDHVCFAWNEPEVGFWNAVTEEEESGWRLLPEELCLKNRHDSGLASIPVQIQPEPKGKLKPPAHVLYAEMDGKVVVADVQNSRSFTLNGVASDIWQAIVKHDNFEDMITALFDAYETDEATLREDIHAFVEELLSQGLIEKSDG